MIDEATRRFLIEFVEASCSGNTVTCPEFVTHSAAWSSIIRTICRWGMQSSLADLFQKSEWAFKVPTKIRLRAEERSAKARLLNLARKQELEVIRKILKDGRLPVLFIGKTALRQRFESRDENAWQFASTVIELGCFDLRKTLLVLGRHGYRSTIEDGSSVELRHGSSPNRIRLHEVLSTERTVIDFNNDAFLDWTARLTTGNDDWLISPETLILLQRELGIDLPEIPKHVGLGMKYDSISEAWMRGSSPPKWRGLVSQLRQSLFGVGKDGRK